MEFKEIEKNFENKSKEIDGLISRFSEETKLIGSGDRNIIKRINLSNITVAVKSFKIPNLINQITYRFFRKSKAQRSFEYANILLKHNLGTPQPIAYYEYYNLLLFKRSFYISEHLDADLTYRELTFDHNYPDFEKILRGFTKFTYKLHQNNINFLDHSPGNTLIKKNDDDYDFYLVDLNRMKFGPMDLETRIKNFSRLTTHKSMVEIMSDEYAICSGEPYKKIYELMWKYTEEFQHKYHRKIKLKNQLFFWRAKR